MEPPGDHQVQHDEEVSGQIKHNSLPQATEIEDGPASRLLEGRVYTAEEKRAGQTDLLQRLPDGAGPQRFQIDDDVGKLWHGVVRGEGFYGMRTIFP